MSLNRVWIPSPNHSPRNAVVRLIVIHTAEGARTYQSLGNYFQNPENEVSSHVGIDDTPNTVGEYVYRDSIAWTQAGANPYAISGELCAFAAWTPADWSMHPEMLRNTAQWIKEEASYFGLPIVKLSPEQAQLGGRGVCGHVDLGIWGGSHHDPGPNFPWNEVLDLANEVPKPELPIPINEETMQATYSPDGTLVIVGEAIDNHNLLIFERKPGQQNWSVGDITEGVKNANPKDPRKYQIQ